ncbi:hypothetical protein HNY73_000355 [Argiope bruennichi]|uniref:Uncharacterized protein n=1 Tax=Argiope bruennichi TaxID=94029 RepID=A0A8T0G0F6_ARGBR|nr:hypothetical protein HNY73_000355 [Argiope bruennichi]
MFVLGDVKGCLWGSPRLFRTVADDLTGTQDKRHEQHFLGDRPLRNETGEHSVICLLYVRKEQTPHGRIESVCSLVNVSIVSYFGNSSDPPPASQSSNLGLVYSKHSRDHVYRNDFFSCRGETQIIFCGKGDYRDLIGRSAHRPRFSEGTSRSLALSKSGGMTGAYL